MQQKIIQLLKAQDAKAIALLYDYYVSALYNVVLRIVSSPELAEQVIQDTFLKAWRSGIHYDESKGSLYTWLLKIAYNTAIDVTRTAHFRNSTKTENIDQMANICSIESFNPEVVGLKEAVQQMDEKYRVLINMIYFGGYTHKEVSEAICVPIGTVKTRTRNAISALRKIFDQNHCCIEND